MNCPRCGGHAENIGPADFDGMIVRCGSCFPAGLAIAGGYERKLSALDAADYEAVFKKAAKNKDRKGRPTIDARAF